MNREIEDHVRGLSDIELLEYTKIDTYLPEAIEFARQELGARNLSPEQLSALESELLQEQKLAFTAYAAISMAKIPVNWMRRSWIHSLRWSKL